VLLIQIAAALLLLLGTGLIFRALLEIDSLDRPRPAVRPRRLPAPSDSDIDLPRAA
jgi:hypothetical protein